MKNYSDLLNGKAKQDFWLSLSKTDLENLDGYSNLFQSALIIEWLDSVGIYVQISHSWLRETFAWMICENSGNNLQNGFKTRKEATEKAIEKANEIYNNGK